MRFTSFIVAAVSLIVLAGCSSDGKLAGIGGARCPETGFLKYTDTITYTNTDYVLNARMENFGGGCSFGEKGVTVNARLAMAAFWENNGMEAPKRVRLKYFATILDDQDNVLAKKEFGAVAKMEGVIGRTEENITLHIPLERSKQAHKRKILFGFAVSPGQYIDNQTFTLPQEQAEAPK